MPSVIPFSIWIFFIGCFLTSPVNGFSQHNYKKEPLFALKKECETPGMTFPRFMSNGDIWFGSYTNGIFRWDNGYLNPVFNEKNGLPDNQVWIFTDKDSVIWFRTGNGKQGHIAGNQVVMVRADDGCASILSAGNLIFILNDSLFLPKIKQPWTFLGPFTQKSHLATNISADPSIFFTKVDPQKKQMPLFYKQPIHGVPEQMTFPVLTEYLDHQTYLYAVLESGEMLFRDAKQDKMVLVKEGRVVWEHIPEVRWVFPDSDDRNIYLIEQCDKKRLNRKYRIWEWQKDHFVRYSFISPEPLIFSGIAKDMAGNLWIGTDKQLYRLFTNTKVFSGDDNMPDNIWSVGEDKKGRLFLGSYGENMVVLEDGKLRPPPPPLQHFTNWMMGAEQVNGQLWIPIEAGNGIARIYDNFTADTILSGNTFYFLRQNPDKSITAGSNGKGLFYLPPGADPEWIHNWMSIDSTKGMSLPHVSCMVQDTFQRIFGGHFRHGIFCYDPKKDTACTWRRKDSKQGYGVMSLERDRWGNIWFGTTQGLRFYGPTLAPFDPARDLKPVLCRFFDGQLVTAVRLKNQDTLLIGSEKLLFALDLNYFYSHGAALAGADAEKGIALNAFNSGLSAGAGQNGIFPLRDGSIMVASEKSLTCFPALSFPSIAEEQYLSIEKILFLDKEHDETSIIPGQAIRFPFNRRMARFILRSWSNLNCPPDSIRLVINGKVEKTHPFVIGAPQQFEYRFDLPILNYSVQFQAMRYGQVLTTVDADIRANLGWAEVFAIALFFGFSFYLYFAVQKKKWQEEMDQTGLEKAILNERNIQSSLELEKQRLQITAFVNQLNPHFLKNILHPIQGRVFRHDRQLANLLGDLGGILDIIVQSGKKQSPGIHTLEDELKLSQKYLSIQQNLFSPDKITFSMPEKALQEKFGYIKLPVMAVQMFVENAMLHGIEHLTEGGIVNIGMEEFDEFIRITVDDNGVGLDASRHIERNKGTEHTSLGIPMMQGLFDAFNRYNDQKLSFRLLKKHRLNKGQGVIVQIDIPKKFRYGFSVGEEA